MKLYKQLSKSSLVFSTLSEIDDAKADDEQESDADNSDEIKPINEIFICFDHEEFFEGHPDHGSNFDIVEHLVLCQDGEAEENHNEFHMATILDKRAKLRQAAARKLVKSTNPMNGVKKISSEIMDNIATRIHGQSAQLSAR